MLTSCTSMKRLGGKTLQLACLSRAGRWKREIWGESTVLCFDICRLRDVYTRSKCACCMNTLTAFKHPIAFSLRSKGGPGELSRRLGNVIKTPCQAKPFGHVIRLARLVPSQIGR